MNQTLKRNSRQRKNLKTKDDEEKVDEEPHKEINNADSVILSAVFWNLYVLQY